jgi:hypothetical protein
MIVYRAIRFQGSSGAVIVMRNTFAARAIAGALFCGMIIGLFAGAAYVNVKADTNPANNPTPESPKVAYVDFLKLLQSYGPLQRAKFEISQDLEQSVMAMQEEFQPLFEQQQRILEETEPDHRNYRNAMRELVRLKRTSFQQRMQAEHAAQADARDESIEAFKRIRTLVTEVAHELGYSQVMNIVREPELAAGMQQNLEMLQQQLLISPVLVFDQKHDLTELMLERGEELWGTHISFKDSAIVCTHDGELLELNEEGEYIVRLGQAVQFSVVVLQRKEPVHEDSEEAGLRWWRDGGLDLGTLNVNTGEYTAPENNPGRDHFRLTVRSRVDPTVTAEVNVRLVDAEGNALDTE